MPILDHKSPVAPANYVNSDSKLDDAENTFNLYLTVFYQCYESLTILARDTVDDYADNSDRGLSPYTLPQACNSLARGIMQKLYNVEYEDIQDVNSSYVSIIDHVTTLKHLFKHLMFRTSHKGSSTEIQCNALVANAAEELMILMHRHGKSMNISESKSMSTTHNEECTNRITISWNGKDTNYLCIVIDSILSCIDHSII